MVWSYHHQAIHCGYLEDDHQSLLARRLRQRKNNTTSSKVDEMSNRTSSAASPMELVRRGRPAYGVLISTWLNTFGPCHIVPTQRVKDSNLSESFASTNHSGSQSCVLLWPSSFSRRCQRLANRPPEARFKYNLPETRGGKKETQSDKGISPNQVHAMHF